MGVHAACAAKTGDPASGGLIVVGVDGSEPSLRALEFAVHEAKLRAARVRVVCVWRLDGTGLEARSATLDDAVASSRAAAEAAASNARDFLMGAWPRGTAVVVIREGRVVADALVAEAEAAVLLVVGGRGHGRLGTLLLGSVSERVARLAPCPVVILPHAVREAGGVTHGAR